MRKILYLFVIVIIGSSCVFGGCADSREPAKKGDRLDIVSLLNDTYEHGIAEATFSHANSDKINYTLIWSNGYTSAMVDVNISKTSKEDSEVLEDNVLTRVIESYEVKLSAQIGSSLLPISLTDLADLVCDNLCDVSGLENFILDLSETYGKIDGTVSSAGLNGYFLGKYEGYDLKYSLNLKINGTNDGYSFAQYGDNKAVEKFKQIMNERESAADGDAKEIIRKSYIATDSCISLYYNLKFDETGELPNMGTPTKIINSISQKLPGIKD